MAINKYNRKVERYLNDLYPKEKDRAQIKDLFEGIVDLPSTFVTIEQFLKILDDVRAIGYVDDYFNAVTKISQGVQYHNSVLIDPSDDFSYIQEGVYLDRDEILKICKNVPNPRDQAAILGVFEGLMGADMKELLEIRPQDISEDQRHIYIQSRDDTVEVSPELMEFIKKAREQTEYLFITKGVKSEILPLEDNGTMLKSLKKGKQGDARLIFQNLVKLAALLDFKEPITLRHIRNCGKKYYLEKLCDYWIADPQTALKDDLKVRDAYFKRFGLNAYISLNKMMAPINRLVPRPK